VPMARSFRARRDRRLLTIRQPIGVCAAITPWNFPLAMITRKVAPALAAGCTVVVKPAEQTPLTALALASLAHDAGCRPGVFNVLTGDPLAIGGVLTASPVVRKLSFTGSTEVGRLLMAQCAPTIKKLSLELGGNAPFIVFDDADVAAAVEGAIVAKYRNTGQTCVCANRLLVQDGVYERFVEQAGESRAVAAVGPGSEEGVAQGPLIDEAASPRSRRISPTLSPGRARVTGGSRHVRGGTFFEPTVLADVTPKCASRAKKPSGRWRRCSGLRTRRRPCTWPTTPSSVSPPTSIRVTSRAACASVKRSNTA
jgi:succinate-semialdehyde dehydrogenase/glutarate-semialdehyde dehydrogenase